jgi:hypothetical protein
MESLLRLPENVAAAKEKRNAATTSSRSANKAAPTNAAPIVPVSLLRRNQRFQIGFLESLQVVLHSASSHFILFLKIECTRFVRAD